jgi:hypothetical protein
MQLGHIGIRRRRRRRERSEHRPALPRGCPVMIQFAQKGQLHGQEDVAKRCALRRIIRRRRCGRPRDHRPVPQDGSTKIDHHAVDQRAGHTEDPSNAPPPHPPNASWSSRRRAAHRTNPAVSQTERRTPPQFFSPSLLPSFVIIVILANNDDSSNASSAFLQSNAVAPPLIEQPQRHPEIDRGRGRRNDARARPTDPSVALSIASSVVLDIVVIITAAAAGGEGEEEQRPTTGIDRAICRAYDILPPPPRRTSQLTSRCVTINYDGRRRCRRSSWLPSSSSSAPPSHHLGPPNLEPAASPHLPWRRGRPRPAPTAVAD